MHALSSILSLTPTTLASRSWLTILRLGLVGRNPRRSCVYKEIVFSALVGFLDAASKEEECECVAYIVLNLGLSYHFCWSRGFGSNSRAELVALWGVLRCGSWLAIEEIDIYGDSRSVIEWAQGKSSFRAPIHSNWMWFIHSLMAFF